MLRSRRTHAVLALALSVPLFMFGDRVLAIQDSEDKVWFGPVGIAPGERALVNIYAVGNPNDVGNPNELPWTFVVRVFDPRGKVVQEQKLQLAAGMIGSVAVAVQDEQTSRRKTEPTHISCRDRRLHPQPDPPGKWAATLEVVDRLSGRTSILIGNPDTLPAGSN